MLTAEEIADLAAEEAAALPQTCRLIEPVPVSDGAGGFTVTTSERTLPCRVEPLAASDLAVNERLSRGASYAAILPAGTAVGEEAVLSVGGRRLVVTGRLDPLPYPVATVLLLRDEA